MIAGYRFAVAASRYRSRTEHPGGDTSKWFHPWFLSYNPEFEKMWSSVVNLGEWDLSRL
jgi:hypothetical protein